MVVRGVVTGVALAVLALHAHADLVPRNVRVEGRHFVLASTGEEIVLSGPNVVVKGPPYLPSVSGNTHCSDVVNDACTALGNCTSCETFNEADIAHMKAQGWNAIRLGVVWAGAQPKDEDQLDPAFVQRLHAVLNLTDTHGSSTALPR